MDTKLTKIPTLTLIVALSLSTVAAYYSIVGLTAIFAGAMIPVIIMGSILEVAKITTTVWLRTYWHQCSWLLKTYLVPAVIVLALITSLGIFGFLSKAHIDQGVPTSDIAAKVALLDENIKTQRDNIKANKDALAQLDAQVNNVMIKGDSEKSAERSVQIRRQQIPERAKLQREIEKYNAAIATLNTEKAPIASQLRKVEAEVGPIKYISAMIYGDNADQSLLEKSVRWVIILLVLVFDPLAIALILAANQSKQWELDAKIESAAVPQLEGAAEPVVEKIASLDDEKFDFSKHPYLFFKDIGFSKQMPEPLYKADIAHPKWSQSPEHWSLEPMSEPAPEVAIIEPVPEVAVIEPVAEEVVIEPEPVIETIAEEIVVEPEPVIETIAEEVVVEPAPEVAVIETITEEVVVEPAPEVAVIELVAEEVVVEPVIETIAEEVVVEPEATSATAEYTILPGGYASYRGKHMNIDVLKGIRPDLFNTSDTVHMPYGVRFPAGASVGECLVRIDMTPHRVYKYNGIKWLPVSDAEVATLNFDSLYIQYLIGILDRGEYDISLVTETEKAQIEEYLRLNPI